MLNSIFHLGPSSHQLELTLFETEVDNWDWSQKVYSLGRGKIRSDIAASIDYFNDLTETLESELNCQSNQVTGLGNHLAGCSLLRPRRRSDGQCLFSSRCLDKKINGIWRQFIHHAFYMRLTHDYPMSTKRSSNTWPISVHGSKLKLKTPIGQVLFPCEKSSYCKLGYVGFLP